MFTKRFLNVSAVLALLAVMAALTIQAAIARPVVVSSTPNFTTGVEYQLYWHGR